MMMQRSVAELAINDDVLGETITVAYFMAMA